MWHRLRHPRLRMLRMLQYRVVWWWTRSRHSSGGTVPPVNTSCCSALPSRFWLSCGDEFRRHLTLMTAQSVRAYKPFCLAVVVWYQSTGWLCWPLHVCDYSGFLNFTLIGWRWKMLLAHYEHFISCGIVTYAELWPIDRVKINQLNQLAKYFSGHFVRKLLSGHA